ncbi:MAG: YbjN domain-containing protein [Pseudomonadota bacterium]
MSLSQTDIETTNIEALDVIEEMLEAAGWQHEREEVDDAVQCICPTRWGDMGALFAMRHEPAAIHFSVTLDVKPQPGKRAALAELVMLCNERLWLGHFDYWAEEGVIIFRHALPMLDRDVPSAGEVRSLMAAAVDSCERFVPAFNFLVWAGKSPREAIDAVMFETLGEA